MNYLAVEKKYMDDKQLFIIHKGEAHNPDSIKGYGSTFQEGLLNLLEKIGESIPNDVLNEFKNSEEHGHYTFWK